MNETRLVALREHLIREENRGLDLGTLSFELPANSPLSLLWSYPLVLSRTIAIAIATPFGDRLVRNLGWYGLAEVCSRLSRLLAAVCLARTLTAVELGTAAIAITCFELIRVLTNNGIGQMVGRSAPDALAATCNTAKRASMFACIVACVLQLAVGLVMGLISGRYDIAAMIAVLSIVYLIMLPGLVPVYLIIRESRMKELAAVSVLQVSLDNLLTITLALTGCGAWSIVLPKLLTTPVWLFGVRYCRSWSPDTSAGTISMSSMLSFSLPILLSEVLAAARLNLDKFLVWNMLGVEALGLYYFAFNAGIGLSLALTSALSNALYPELAKYASQPELMLSRYNLAVIKTALPISAIIMLQSALSLVYVPLVFGAKWQHASVLVALLCLSAVSKPFSDAGAQLMRASGQSKAELACSIALTVATLLALRLGLEYGLMSGIVLFTVMSASIQITITVFAPRIAINNLVRPVQSTPLPSI